MPSPKTIIVSTSTGVFIAIGWWVFIDGAINAPDAFPWFHIIPAFSIMMAMFAINLTNPSQIEESGAIRLYLFFWFTVAMVCIGVAIWITSVEYPPDYNWPGVAIILQTMFVFMGGVIFLVGRHSDDSLGY